jgi:hypothetical protein
MKRTLFIKAADVFNSQSQWGSSNIKLQKIRLIRFHAKPAKGIGKGLLIIYKDYVANLTHFFPVFA